MLVDSYFREHIFGVWMAYNWPVISFVRKKAEKKLDLGFAIVSDTFVHKFCRLCVCVVLYKG